MAENCAICRVIKHAKIHHGSPHSKNVEMLISRGTTRQKINIAGASRTPKKLWRVNTSILTSHNGNRSCYIKNNNNKIFFQGQASFTNSGKFTFTIEHQVPKLVVERLSGDPAKLSVLTPNPNRIGKKNILPHPSIGRESRQKETYEKATETYRVAFKKNTGLQSE